MNKKKLNHVAIVPDGNRRWASKHNLPFWKGHQQGTEMFKELAQEVLDQGISYLTFWIASKDNLTKRSKKEVKFLFELFIKCFQELLESDLVQKNRIRIHILGSWRGKVPPSLEKVLDEIIKKTKKFDKHHLTFLLNYDGKEDVLHAIKKLRKLPPEKINENTVHKNLITSSLPPVDLMIRTGGEPHNSAGFLMWQTAYSQYYFTQTFFPAFNKEKFREAIENYMKRGRRFGK